MVCCYIAVLKESIASSPTTTTTLLPVLAAQGQVFPARTTSSLTFCTLMAPVAPLSWMTPGTAVFSSWMQLGFALSWAGIIPSTPRSRTKPVMSSVGHPACRWKSARHQDGCTCTQPRNSSSYHPVVQPANNYLNIFSFSFLRT